MPTVRSVPARHGRARPRRIALTEGVPVSKITKGHGIKDAALVLVGAGLLVWGLVTGHEVAQYTGFAVLVWGAL